MNNDDDRRDDNVIPMPGLRRPPPPSPGDGPGADFEEGIAFLDPGPPDGAILASAAEAVLFTLADPVPLPRLRSFLGDPEEDQLRASLVQLQARYDRGGHGIRLVEVAGGWQLRTHPRFATWVVRSRGNQVVRLSKAALEALSIIAYRQPVSRGEVEDIRGVDTGGVIRTLLGRNLVRCMGHRDEPGRPLLYGTTPQFLEMFGLRDLSDLPTLRDLRELKDDDPHDAVGLGDPEEEGEGPPWEDEEEPPIPELFWLPPPKPEK